MNKSQINYKGSNYRSRNVKRVVKRLDVPVNDIKNIEDAAETLMDAAVNLKKILDYKVPVFRKLQCAQSELQGAANWIRWQDNPGIRAYEEKLEAEKNADS